MSIDREALRPAFEAWHKDAFPYRQFTLELSAHPGEEGDYVSSIVQSRWTGFIAAFELLTGEAALERGARAQIVRKFGEAAIQMFDPPPQASAKELAGLLDRAAEARLDARAVLLAAATVPNAGVKS